jgi:Lon protease-like protein
MNAETPTPEADDETLVELPLFPLRTVLFPGGLLGLKVFEARYLDLMSRCMRNGQGFGVIALHSGQEARRAAGEEVSLETVGVLAEIIDVDSPQSGILELRCRGTRRFAPRSVAQQADGLWVAQVVFLPDDLPDDLSVESSDDLPDNQLTDASEDDSDGAPRDAPETADKSEGREAPDRARGPAAHKRRLAACAEALANAIEAMTAQGAEPFLPPLRMEDAGWVANRWCEILPISQAAKQKLMALDDAQVRLRLVSDFLRSKGVIEPD